METKTKVCKCCGRELPETQFSKNLLGYTNVCQECNKKNRAEALAKRKADRQKVIDALNDRQLRLNDFTPRELMEELARRGYKGKLTYTQVQEIDLERF